MAAKTPFETLLELYRKGQTPEPAAETKRYITRRSSAQLAPQFIGVMKQCPKCGGVKLIIDAFGVRPGRHGGYRPQSYCRACRSALGR